MSTKRENKSTHQEENTKRQKKEPKIPAFDPIQYFEPIMYMLRLSAAWNLLDEGEYSGVYYGQHERREYLRDIQQILDTGSSAYRNPIGTDDRESFSDTFSELTENEQRDFQKLLVAAMRQNRAVTEAEIRGLFSSPPKDYWYISLQPSDEPYQDGSDRFPFKSMEAALDRFERLPRSESYHGIEIEVVCGPDCQRQKCCRSSCKHQVCLEHGSTGEGRILQMGSASLSHGEEDFADKLSKCMDCGKVSCHLHEFKVCNVCMNAYGGEASLGIHDGYADANFHLCNDCATVCKGTVEIDTGGDRGVGSVCGFRCCKQCLKEHTCGDDPTEYC